MAQEAIYEPLYIAQSLGGGLECHFLPFRDCTVIARNAQNAISWPLEIARSLSGGSKCHIGIFRDCQVILWSLRGASKIHIWAFGDCAVLLWCLRMLKIPFLGLWRLFGHCAVAQNALSGHLEIALSLRSRCAVA